MKIRSLLAALALGILPVSAAHALSVAITVAPPPIPVYEQPLCPVQGYLWTPGYYAYDYGLGSYYWVDGIWVPPPRVGFLWTPGYWGFADGFYAFHTGYWGPTVGFYGGINYGFGYGGYGYYGGRWAGPVFQYNTAVTRVNVTNIHNTYVNNNFPNQTASRASFNGRNGVVARADRSQLRAAQATRLQATARQRAVRDQARVAHNANRQQNFANRDQARAAQVNRNARQAEARNARQSQARNAAVARRDARMNAANNNYNRRAAQAAVARNRDFARNRAAFANNPGRGQQRLVARGPGGGGGRAFRALAGGRGGGQHAGGGQHGGGGRHNGDPRH